MVGDGDEESDIFSEEGDMFSDPHLDGEEDRNDLLDQPMEFFTA